MEPLVVIVGAGPAGLSCALFLKKIRPDLAARTIVLEKSHHPRKKLCGGGINAKALPLLGELGINLPEDGPPHFTARGYDVRFRDQRSVFHQPGGTLVFDRKTLDAWLCERARLEGIAIREDEAVTRIERHGDHIAVHTSRGIYRAACVVGADGAGSIVRRHAGIEDVFPRARLLQAELPLQTDDPGELLFDFSVRDHGIQGYAWLFPEPSGAGLAAKIGIYDRTPQVSQRVNPRAVLVRMAGRWGYDLPEDALESWSIREWTPKSRLSVPRILLVGDAAGSDPLVAEGLHQAFAYGKLAAAAIIQAAKTGDFRFVSYTRDVRNDLLGAELSRNHIAARLIYGPLYERGLHFGFKNPGILERVFAYIAGKAPELADLGPTAVARKALWHAARKVTGVK